MISLCLLRCGGGRRPVGSGAGSDGGAGSASARGDGAAGGGSVRRGPLRDRDRSAAVRRHRRNPEPQPHRDRQDIQSELREAEHQRDSALLGADTQRVSGEAELTDTALLSYTQGFY